MKRGRIKLELIDGSMMESDASIMSAQWAIHPDPFLEKGKHYVLTHIPTGRRAWSSKTQMFLKRLIQEPEFLETIDASSQDSLRSLNRAIKRFCGENGWK